MNFLCLVYTFISLHHSYRLNLAHIFIRLFQRSYFFFVDKIGFWLLSLCQHVRMALVFVCLNWVLRPIVWEINWEKPSITREMAIPLPVEMIPNLMNLDSFADMTKRVIIFGPDPTRLEKYLIRTRFFWPKAKTSWPVIRPVFFAGQPDPTRTI